MSTNNIKKIAFLSFFLLVVIHLIYFYFHIKIPLSLLLTGRVIICALFFIYAVYNNKLTTWIFVSMLIGAEIGHDLPEVGSHLKIGGQIFLKLIKAIIAPLLFATLAFGIASHSNLKQIGSMAWKSILYFEIVTTLALFIGLICINISKPGTHIQIPASSTIEKIEVKSQTWEDIILHIFPENIAKSIAEGQILQIVIFSIIFGVALALVKEKLRLPMLNFLESLSETMFKFTNIVMYLAPFAVGASIAYTVSQLGIGILVNLFHLLATLYIALIVFILLVFIPIAIICKIPILKFAKAISEPVSLAFATTSSEAALPKAMEAMEGFGVPRKIIAFVMPMGYSFNLDGTTVYLSLASVFVAQVAGIELSWEKQLLMVFTLMLTSKGIAGIPRASLVVLMGTAAAFGLPTEPIFIILGIDELMDMARTSVNVIGNCLATVVIAKWEGEFSHEAERIHSQESI
jgi:proton glutamate symport protein